MLSRLGVGLVRTFLKLNISLGQVIIQSKKVPTSPTRLGVRASQSCQGVWHYSLVFRVMHIDNFYNLLLISVLKTFFGSFLNCSYSPVWVHCPKVDTTALKWTCRTPSIAGPSPDVRSQNSTLSWGVAFWRWLFGGLSWSSFHPRTVSVKIVTRILVFWTTSIFFHFCFSCSLVLNWKLLGSKIYYHGLGFLSWNNHLVFFSPQINLSQIFLGLQLTTVHKLTMNWQVTGNLLPVAWGYPNVD